MWKPYHSEVWIQMNCKLQKESLWYLLRNKRYYYYSKARVLRDHKKKAGWAKIWHGKLTQRWIVILPWDTFVTFVHPHFPPLSMHLFYLPFNFCQLVNLFRAAGASFMPVAVSSRLLVSELQRTPRKSFNMMEQCFLSPSFNHTWKQQASW